MDYISVVTIVLLIVFAPCGYEMMMRIREERARNHIRHCEHKWKGVAACK